MAELYPWLEPVWNQWQISLAGQRIAASTLVVAPDGFGVQQLTEHFARAMMCTTSATEACGFCHNCSLMQSGTHPDYHIVEPEQAGKAITVEQIRQCNRWAQESSQLSGFRIIVITPADSMNVSASNALLKTLEEPPEKCLFVLVAANVHHLLPTIVSRCQQRTIPTPSAEVIGHWLSRHCDKPVPGYAAHLNGFAPLKTLEFIRQGGVEDYQAAEKQFLDCLAVGQGNQTGCATLLNQTPMVTLGWIWTLLTDAQKVHFGLYSESFTPGSKTLAAMVSYPILYRQSETLLELMDKLRHFTGLNSELLILDWLMNFEEETCL